MNCLLRIVVLSVISMQAVLAQGMKASASGADPLTQALADADKDYKSAQTAIDKAANLGAGFSPCEVSFLQLKSDYAGWFKTEYVALFAEQKKFVEEQRKKFASIISEIRARMDRMKEEPVTAVAVPGQTSDSVPVTFNTIIGYLNNLNQRIKTCAPNELVALMRLQNNPRLNPLHVAHNQVEAAITRMTDNLNASLKESGNKYTVSLQKAACGFDLVLAGEVQMPGPQGQKVHSIHMSLLKPGEEMPTVDQDASETQFLKRIGKYAANPVARYLEMYFEMVDPACTKPGWSDLIGSDFSGNDSDLYVTAASAELEVNRIADLINKNRSDTITPSESCPFIEADYYAYNPEARARVMERTYGSAREQYDDQGRAWKWTFNRLCGPKPRTPYCPYVASEYLDLNPDVKNSSYTADRHFIASGHREDRNLSKACEAARKRFVKP